MRKPPINDEEHLNILSDFDKGMSVRAIASRYGRGFSTIKGLLLAEGIESPVRRQRKFGHNPFKKKDYCKCEDCQNLRREARTRTAADIRRTNLKYSHGITPEEYDEMFESQQGLCASCEMPETHENQYGTIPLAVDHDHRCCPGDRSCGKCVRGLLCHCCNTAEGLLKTPENALKLAEYMRRTSK